ncbi:MAG: hypothetical protein K1X67_13015 [Fimbriimonadaceae bacterium]|nr:hypothetical protein [Fimbriimonadaceae bacterium]
MNAELYEMVGDLSRFKADTAQVRGLVEAQQPLWNSLLGSWVVVPLRGYADFLLLAHDIEGERQAREVIAAFVGPAIASLTSGSGAFRVGDDEYRVVPISVRPDKHAAFLDAIETMTTTRASIDRDPPESKLDESDLLRDMRLALSQQDFATAQNAYEGLRRLGTLSQENMRFLRMELLAGQGSWEALVGLPYFEEIQKTRRPRTVSEFMLEAIWHTHIAPTGRPPVQVFRESDLQSRYGPLLGSVDVPRSRGALAMAYLSAQQDGDQARVERQLCAAGDEERLFLEGIGWQSPVADLAVADPVEELRRLYDRQQFSAVVDLFLADPNEHGIGLAIDAVLELDDAALAVPVLDAVRRLASNGVPIPRAVRLLLPHVDTLVSDACNDWIQWMKRVAASERWASAASTARQSAQSWPTLADSEDVSNQLAEDLLNAIDGSNSDQIRATLDLLCDLAAAAVGKPSQRKFVDAVLFALAFQDNASEAVRNAFNDLAWAVLDSAPDQATYTSLLATASDLWVRIASLTSIDWALQVLDGFVSHNSPVPEDRLNFAHAVVRLATRYVQRMEPSQIVSMRSLLEELGLPPWPELPTGQTEDNPWSALDSASLGLYTLLESAVPKFRQRLEELTHLKSFTHNKDTHGTPALRNLASSAEYFIVDTWHAKHAATTEIDKIRPKSRQILPRRGGAVAFLQALREFIANQQD